MRRVIPQPSMVFGITTLVAVILGASSAYAIPAFSGAEGYGANSAGGRGGDVYHVTSLADSNAPGTLRYGLNSATGPRTIVFDISGTIALTSELDVSKNNITIAGQTAPGQGICIRNYEFHLTGNDVDVRHISSREGVTFNMDAISVYGGTNVIVDHCSASWATDEVLSSTHAAKTVTIQNCFVTEALNPLGHGYGSLLRVNEGANQTTPFYFSFYNNLYVDNWTRNPRPGYYPNDSSDPNLYSTLYLDFRNNVIYNWSDQAGYFLDDGNGRVHMNYVGNYLIAGPSTPTGSKSSTAFSAGGAANEMFIYQSGNKIDPNHNGVLDGTDTGWAMFEGNYTTRSEFTMDPNCPAVYTMTADQALATVLNSGGAFSWNRNSVDANIVAQVRSYGTAGTMYTSVTQAGGWPTYPQLTRDANFDTDGDGMSNAWEIAHGLDPNVADNNGDIDNDGYTNLEEYLMSLAPIAAPKTIVWAGGTAGRYELITNWDIPWQPTLADKTEIDSGKAIVAYPNQEAGTLYVANTAGGSAELAVTAGGTLNVAYALYVGNATNTAGTATLSGGSLGSTLQIVGNLGNGTFNQSGGTNTTAYLGLGSAPAASGAYALSGGSVSALFQTVGNSGTGTFDQSAGTNTGYMLSVGNAPGSHGTYTLSGGSLSMGAADVGSSGTGLFNQSGGTHTMSDSLYLGHYYQSCGTYSLSGGVMTVGGSITLGVALDSQGILNLTGGSLTATGPILLATDLGSTAELTVAKAAYIQAGGLTINSGGGRSTQVTIELDSNGHSLIGSSGTVSLAGALDLQSLNSYRPHQGDTFTLITSTGMGGNFSSLTSNLVGQLLLDPNDPCSGYWPIFRGAIDANTQSYVVTFQGAMAGDATGDNVVDGNDFGALARNWMLSGKTWADGDFNGDGTVDDADFGSIARNWGSTGLAPAAAPDAPIPEPVTLALLAAGGMALIRRRR